MAYCPIVSRQIVSRRVLIRRAGGRRINLPLFHKIRAKKEKLFFIFFHVGRFLNRTRLCFAFLYNKDFFRFFSVACIIKLTFSCNFSWSQLELKLFVQKFMIRSSTLSYFFANSSFTDQQPFWIAPPRGTCLRTSKGINRKKIQQPADSLIHYASVKPVPG